MRLHLVVIFALLATAVAIHRHDPPSPRRDSSQLRRQTSLRLQSPRSRDRLTDSQQSQQSQSHHASSSSGNHSPASSSSGSGQGTPFSVFFSGGGIRAAIGTWLAAEFLRYQYPASFAAIEEVHALSGGAWGTLLAQEDFGRVCHALLSDDSLIGPESIRFGFASTFWRQWAYGVQKNFLKRLGDDYVARGNQDFGQFRSTFGRKICFTFAEQKTILWGRKATGTSCDFCPSDGHGVSVRCSDSEEYHDPQLRTELPSPLTPEGEVTEGQHGHPMTLLEAMTYTSAAWGYGGVSIVGGGSTAPKIYMSGREWLFTDGGLVINLPAAVTVIDCIKSKKACPPMILFDYSDDKTPDVALNKLRDEVEEKTGAKLFTYKDPETCVHTFEYPSLMSHAKGWKHGDKPWVKGLYVAFCFARKAGAHKQFVGGKSFSTVHGLITTLAVKDAAIGTAVQWDRDLVAQAMAQYGDFLDQHRPEFNRLLGEKPAETHYFQSHLHDQCHEERADEFGDGLANMYAGRASSSSSGRGGASPSSSSD